MAIKVSKVSLGTSLGIRDGVSGEYEDMMYRIEGDKTNIEINEYIVKSNPEAALRIVAEAFSGEYPTGNSCVDGGNHHVSFLKDVDFDNLKRTCVNCGLVSDITEEQAEGYRKFVL